MAQAQRWAVLASGTGSLFKATIEADIPIAQFLTDRPCRAFDIARGAGIQVHMVERRDFNRERFESDRLHFTLNIAQFLKHTGVTHIAMMGFESIFSPPMFSEGYFKNHIYNSHPSLLPSFPGMNAPHQAVAHGVHWTGCTIHIATEKLDDGPILAQVPVPVKRDDDGDTLWERIKIQERKLWPKVIRQIMAA